MSSQILIVWLRLLLFVFALGAGATPLLGCSVLGALGNPKVAFAIQEDTSMYVVQRRSTAAEKIANGVDSAMSKSPGEGDDGWITKLSEPAADLRTEMTAASKRHHYANGHAPMRVLPSEGWAKVLPEAVENGSGRTLFAMMGGSLVVQYNAVAELKRQIGGVRGKMEENNLSMGKEGATDAEVARLSRQNDVLSTLADKLDERVAPLLDKLIESARDAASKVNLGGEARRIVTVVARLRQAVEDAKVANGAALVGYPKAIPSLLNTLPNTVVGFVAEYVEENTGKIVDTKKISPTVTLDGVTPKVSINGLDANDLGKLSMDDLTSAVLEKTKKFVTDSFGLPARVGRTAELLTLESSLLDAILDGLKSQGITPPEFKDIEPLQVTPPPGTAKRAKK
jgi:hypothetical protein